MADIKAKDIITEVRGALDDKDEPYRFSDTSLLSFLADAQEFVATGRPDAATSATGTMRTITAPADLNTTLSLDSKWRPAMFQYVLMRALQLRGGDRENLARVQAALAALTLAMRA